MHIMSLNNYVPRVTQLDALQLDDEVVNVLKGQLLETSKYFSPGVLTPVVPELELILRSLVFRYSVYENASTFGQQMLSLKYDKTLLSKSKLYWFYGYTILLKYIKERLFLNFTSNKKAQCTIAAIEKFQTIGDFLNFLRFMQSGKNPALVDFLLNLEVASEERKGSGFTDYAWTRELIWHSFIELLGFAAPLLNTNIIRRIIKDRSFNVFRRNGSPVYSTFTNSVPTIKMSTKCAECGENPILPHHMGCEHIFCHYCLQANKLDNPQYKCPRCSFIGKHIARVPCG